MRRFAMISLFVSSVLLAGLGLPIRHASTEAPNGKPGKAKLDIQNYSLGEILEGSGPPLERFHPGAVESISGVPMAPKHAKTQDLPLPTGMIADFRHYLSSEEINQALAQWETTYPDLVQTYSIGTTWQGRPIKAVRLTNENAPGPVADRPAMYIDAQHHAREIISKEVAMYTAWWLINFYGKDPFVTHLMDTRVVYVLPSANPDGNQIAVSNYQDIRKTANPKACDDDNDGKWDEDYSDNYGYGTDEAYRYEFDQAWADANPDDPFVGDWQRHMLKNPEYAGRFTGVFGGPRNQLPEVDRDGDGQVHEDEIGGTDPNRNYDIQWDGPGSSTDCRSQTFRGPETFSEPETKAIRDFVQELPHLATGLSYHSGTDLILHPWGYSRTAYLPDMDLFELFGRKGSQLTEVNGYRGSAHTWTARGLYAATGSTMDYLYATRGVYAFSPEVYGSDSTTLIERLGATGTYTVGASLAKGFNPDPGEIVANTDRWNRFALFLLSAVPNVELNGILVRNGELTLALGNDGILPADVTLTLDGVDGLPMGGEGTKKTLQATSQCWSFPLEDLKQRENTLRVTVNLPVGTIPHEVEKASWTFSIEPNGQVSLSSGVARPFVDLGKHFDGGWWADLKWDAAGSYHLPGDNPILSKPPQIQPPCELAGLPTPVPPATPTAVHAAPHTVYLPLLRRAN